MGVSLREYLKYGAKGPTTRGTRTDRTRVAARTWSSYVANHQAAVREASKWRAIAYAKRKKREEIVRNARETNRLD